VYNIRPGWIVPKYSSLPSYLTAPNGLNFSKSVSNPNSRLNRVREYLIKNGPSSKREILRDVFGKEVGKSRREWTGTRMVNHTPNVVTTGWGCYLFTYGCLHGFFTKVRRGNVWYWSAN